jgi:hypothetical protein
MGPSFATFPGLFISRADMVLSHGVTPSVCCVVAVPQSTSITTGDLVLGDAGVPVIVFRDCAMDHNWDSPPYVKRGQRSNFRILDRRWRWKGCRISGRYNVRRPDALPRETTKKSYRELIELLLFALGEMSPPDITVPCADKDGPTVEWACARADLELAQLVENIGGVIVLGLDDLIHIVANGTGPIIPPNGRERIPQNNFLPATSPWASRADYGPTRFQSKILLEAVGLDNTGEVVALDDLSYKPSGGWRLQVPGVYNDVTDDDDRALARESVYKWYRVKTQKDGSLTLPGGIETISDITDILPLFDDLIIPPKYIGTEPSSITNFPPDKAYIEGYFFDGDLKGINENSGELSRWDDAFFLDRERGIVKFDEYMYQVATDGHADEAELYLECSYCARANVYSSPWHYHYDVPTGTGHTEYSGVAITPRKDLFKWVVQSYSGSGYAGVYSNVPTLDTLGQSVADSFANTFRGVPQHDQQWVGIVPYSVNGNVHQMRWVVGGGPAMTYGSMNSEVPHFGPTNRERRIREEVDRRLFP